MIKLLIELWEAQEELYSLQKEIWNANKDTYYDLIKKNATKNMCAMNLHSTIISELNQQKN